MLSWKSTRRQAPCLRRLRRQGTRWRDEVTLHVTRALIIGICQELTASIRETDSTGELSGEDRRDGASVRSPRGMPGALRIAHDLARFAVVDQSASFEQRSEHSSAITVES